MCGVGIWRLRRNTLTDEGEQGGIVAESNAEGQQEQMPGVVDHVVEPRVKKVAVLKACSERLGPGSRKPEPTELCTEVPMVEA